LYLVVILLSLFLWLIMMSWDLGKTYQIPKDKDSRLVMSLKIFWEKQNSSRWIELFRDSSNQMMKRMFSASFKTSRIRKRKNLELKSRKKKSIEKSRIQMINSLVI